MQQFRRHLFWWCVALGLQERLFAQRYPTEVVGMLLADATYENGNHFICGRKLRPATDSIDKPIAAVKTGATKEDNNLARTPEARKFIRETRDKKGTHLQ